MAQIKRKVSLRQKVTGNEVSAVPSTSTKPKKTWWPWLLAGVLVCGVIIFLMTRGKDDAKDNMEQSTEQIVEDVPVQEVPDVSIPESNENGKGESTEEQSTAQNETPETEPSQNALDKNTAPQQKQGSSTTKQQAMSKPQVPQPTVQSNISASPNVTMTEANGTIEEEAWRTIRGNYGNGAARKEALGSRYEEIQAKVNDFYREGKVH